MRDLKNIIERYGEKLFADLGPVPLPEDRKADLYARLQEHLHRRILETLRDVLGERERERLHEALERGDYKPLQKISEAHPELDKKLEEKIDEEFNNLQLTLIEEQNHAAKGTA